MSSLLLCFTLHGCHALRKPHEAVQDFIFAREVRLGSYRVATVPPAALVAAKCMAEDPRMEPAHGERVRCLPHAFEVLPVLSQSRCYQLQFHLPYHIITFRIVPEIALK